MDISVGTFNLNNLFSRFNFYTEAAGDQVGLAADGDRAPRDWLIAPTTTTDEAAAGGGDDEPAVEVLSRGELGSDGRVHWERRYKGRLILGKEPEAQRLLAKRIRDLRVDVLAVQEVEDLPTLRDFVDLLGLRDAGFRHLSLVEGNDQRFIDLGVISKLPLGAVVSYKHRRHPEAPRTLIFSRDLAQVEILDPTSRTPVLTVFVNHLKSQLGVKSTSDTRRRRQAETIIKVLEERPPRTPYLVVGDMNDAPDAPPLAAFTQAGLINALAQAEERGGPYPANGEPMPPPPGVPWTHRFRSAGVTTYELYDQIWASPDLEGRLTDAWILRRTHRLGDASDHDPAAVRVSNLQPSP